MSDTERKTEYGIEVRYYNVQVRKDTFSDPKLDTWTEERFEVRVDFALLLQNLARNAYKQKNRRATALGGGVIVKCLPNRRP